MTVFLLNNNFNCIFVEFKAYGDSNNKLIVSNQKKYIGTFFPIQGSTIGSKELNKNNSTASEPFQG